VPTEEAGMADGKHKGGVLDRSRVAASEPYEVSYFAKKHGLTTQQVRDLILEVGSDRDRLEAADAKLSRRK
jgi:hypothetical protein